MATAALLGAAPTLTSVAGGSGLLPALTAGALYSDFDRSSINPKKRSIQTKYLESMTDYTLNIWPNGTIGGMKTSSRSSRRYAMVEFVTFSTLVSTLATLFRVEIRGVESKMWLCMNKTGALYGSREKTDECSFNKELERVKGEDWNSFYSVRHPNNTDKSVKWYIALNRHGRARIAVTTQHKSSRFLSKTTINVDSLPTVEVIPPLDEPPMPKQRYNRVKSDPTNRPTKSRKKNARRNLLGQRKLRKLSEMFSSIEKSLYENKSEENVNSEQSYLNSLLIDIGSRNPFINIETGDGIRHSTKKFSSGRRKTYRRKQSAESMK